MESQDIKLLVRVYTDDSEEFHWIHFCYVDDELYKKFIAIHEDGISLNDLLARWCKKDFNIDSKMDKLEDVSQLKNLIKDVYKERYPELFRDSRTDRQGWTRIWVMEKMREEIELNGK